MKVNFPRGLVFDLSNIPEDFDEQIRKAFHDYTDGTHPDYTFHDKLAFIDRTVELLRRSSDSYDAVKHLLHGLCEYYLDELDRMPESDDYNCIEFMEQCWTDGKKSQRLYGHHTEYSENTKENDEIMKLLIRVMKVVLDYEE